MDVHFYKSLTTAMFAVIGKTICHVAVDQFGEAEVLVLGLRSCLFAGWMIASPGTPGFNLRFSSGQP